MSVNIHKLIGKHPPEQQPRSGNAPIGVRGRPASVDIEGVLIDASDESPSPETGSPQYGDPSDQSSLIQQQHNNRKVAGASNASSSSSSGNCPLSSSLLPSTNDRTSRTLPTKGFSYTSDVMGGHSDAASYVQPHHFGAAGENTPPNCSCSMNAMVICQQCGIFCHDQCMGSAKLCLSCVIRWTRPGSKPQPQRHTLIYLWIVMNDCSLLSCIFVFVLSLFSVCCFHMLRLMCVLGVWVLVNICECMWERLWQIIMANYTVLASSRFKNLLPSDHRVHTVLFFFLYKLNYTLGDHKWCNSTKNYTNINNVHA